MIDLLIGIGVMWLLAAGLFVLALWVGKKVPRWAAALLAVLPAALIGVHAFVLYDNPRLVWVLPLSNLVVVGNVTPLAVGFLGGLAWRHVPTPVWRKALVVLPLFLVCLYVAYWPLLGQPPRCVDTWKDGVSLRTSVATGAASAAATFLRAHDIDTDEAEMAGLCLTRGWGTSRLGLYRGLKLKTAGTLYDVELVSWTLDQLREKGPDPMLLLLSREEDVAADPIRQSNWGLARALPVVIVLFGFVGEEVLEVGDPPIGREQWNVRHIRNAWRGLAFRLVRRTAEAQAAAAP